MKKLFASVFALGCLATAVHAADLPSRYAPPPYAAAPVFTWSGFYAGINGGLGFGGFSNRGGSYFGSNVGGVVGGTAGYNYQSGNLLVGAEGDLDFASVGGGHNPAPGIGGYGNVTGLGTVRARLGYAADRTLFFITGGYAGASVRSNLYDGTLPTKYYVGTSNYMNGFSVGGGVEYAFTDRISVKAEYLYDMFGNNTFFNNTPDTLSSGLHISTVRAGVNYHF